MGLISWAQDRGSAGKALGGRPNDNTKSITSRYWFSKARFFDVMRVIA